MRRNVLVKRIKALASALLCVVVMAGCGLADTKGTMLQAPVQNGMANSDFAEAEFGTMDYVKNEAAESTVETSDNSVQDTSRKLVKNASLDVETKEFDVLLAAVSNKVKELGGYIEDMNVYNGSSYNGYSSSRDASITARIPQKKLDEFLSCVSELGNVTRKNESVEDITLTYVDVASRRDALQTESDRLLVLLEKAETIEDIITIESRLSDVRYQIESIESRIRTFDNQVDYSTVYLNLNEVRELTPIEEETVWEQISGGFVDSVRDVLDGLLDFFIWFVVNIPFFVVWAVIIAIIVLIIRFIRKLRKNRKEKKLKHKNEAVAEPADNNNEKK